MKPRVENVAAWNEHWAREYDIDRYYSGSHWLVRWVESRRLAVAAALLDPPASAPVVELGCGAGHVLARFPGPVLGLEIAPTMLAKARRRLGSRATLLRGDVEQLPLRDGSARWLVCTEVIEHVVHPERLLAEIARVLAPEGRAVVTFPNEALIEAVKQALLRIGLFRWLVPSPTAAVEADWHLHRFSPALFESVRPASLRIVARRVVPSRLMPLRWVYLLQRTD